RHYRKWLICRVPNSLPCAKRRAHGKQPLCRVPKIKHTANPTHTAKLHLCRVPAPGTHGKNQTQHITIFAVCRPQNTRQTSCTCHSRAEVANGGGRRGDGG